MTAVGSAQTGQDAMSLLLLSNSATHARLHLAHALQARPSRLRRGVLLTTVAAKVMTSVTPGTGSVALG